MKKKFSLFFLLLLVLWILCGLLSLRFSLPVPAMENPNFKSELYDFAGSIHFHTLYSDGSGTVEEVLSAGQKAGLDFLIATDHNKEPKKKIREGFYPSPPLSPLRQSAESGGGRGKGVRRTGEGERILLLAGSELSTGKGHYLEMDGLGYEIPHGYEIPLRIVAHPFHPFIPWKDEKPITDFDGLEILNGSAIMKKALLKVFPVVWALLLYPFNPDYAFFSVYEDPVIELAQWDALSQKKRLIGISATDAHANIPLFKNSKWNLKFPSYEFSFKSMKSHILSEEPLLELPFSKAKRNLYNNLKRGRTYFSLDLLLDPAGFKFEGRAPLEQKLFMGDQVKLRKGEKVKFKISLGQWIPKVPLEIRLLRNGELFAMTNSQGLEIETSVTGNYRAEVVLTIHNIFGMSRKVLWIASNPIYVM